jgi:acetate kinase
MGFTAVEGLVMGTRSGSLDPGVLLWMIEQAHMNVDEIGSLLYRRSGLLGVSGMSSDIRTLLASDAPASAEAVDLFCYRIRANSVRWRPRSAGSMRSSSPQASANTRHRCASAYAASRRGWACRSTRARTRDMDRASTIRKLRSNYGSHPTNKELMIARHTLSRLDG